MRILHFAETLPGGPASILEEIAPHQLARWGSDNVRFLLPRKDRHHVPRIPDYAFSGFEYSGRSIIPLWRLSLRLHREIREFRPHILHLHSTFAGLVGRAPWVALNGTKVIYCAHGWAFCRDSGHLSNFGAQVIERILSKRTDAIINISDFEHQMALKAGLPSDRLKLIRNGIADRPRTTRHPHDNGLHILFVGRHDPQKGLDIALSAVSRLTRTDLTLHIVGEPVVSRDREQLTQPNLKVHGWLPREEVFALMERVDALIMPSRWEGFGLAAVEAMRAGIPVIASDAGALPEVVEHGQTGYIFPSEDERSLTKILEELKVPALMKMGQTARIRYESLFRSTAMNAQIDELYTGMTAISARPHKLQ